METLIIVLCHAIWSGVGDVFEDNSWFLKEYQRGEPKYYVDHLRAGIQIAKSDARALLVLSGGLTEAAAGPRSEALSYFLIAERLGLLDTVLRKRCIGEDFATDTLLNCLYSICRFREFVGDYPRRIVAVGWDFKRERVQNLHRSAIRWPAARLEYIGVNNPEDLISVSRDEKATCQTWRSDPYGCGQLLGAKRVRRNPFKRTAPYTISCPEVSELLVHSGPQLFHGQLPWS